MYNAIKVEFWDHSQVSKIYKKTKTAEEAKALAMRWAKKLEAEADSYEKRAVYGVVRLRRL